MRLYAKVVFNATSKTGKLSLNDCLYSGPSLITNLVKILIRFRTYKVALLSDLEKAFLQIKVKEDNRDCMRFLWFHDVRNGDFSIIILRSTVILFGLSPSPFLLSATLIYHLKLYMKTDQALVEMLLESMYVDDNAAGADTTKQGIQVYKRSKEIMKDGGFNMHKWVTNDPDLKAYIDKSEIDGVPPKEVTLVLGLGGCFDNDVIKYNLIPIYEQVQKCTIVTKRVVLSCIAKITDALGLISPLTLTGKLIFKRCCEMKLGWNDSIDGDLKEDFTKWIAEFPLVSEFDLDRKYGGEGITKETEIQIHGFGDASNKAFGSCVYIRFKHGNQYKVSLVYSKTKVIPKGKWTMPRKELQAAVLTAKVTANVEEALRNWNVTDVRMWTDSINVAYWIRQEAKQWKPFEQDRVNKIYSLSNPMKWNHCPGNQNPTDLASRGTSGHGLKESIVWFDGPDFLYKEPDKWPEMEETIKMPDELNPEIKKMSLICAVLNMDEEFIDFKRFSTLQSLIRTTAYVLRFVQCLKKKVKITTMLCTRELQEAESILVKNVQMRSFIVEYEHLV